MTRQKRGTSFFTSIEKEYFISLAGNQVTTWF